MNADKFVERLKVCAPEQSELELQGLSALEAQAFRASFVCKKKPEPTGSDNPLLDFVGRYDCSDVLIGVVSFDNEPSDKGDHWRVGKDEADALVIDKITKRIQVKDHANPEHLIYYCAEDGNKFLDAMLVAACFLGRCSVDENLYNNRDEGFERAKECANAAGGEQYLKFYFTMMGCE